MVNAVKAYAQSYCKLLGHPYTNRTIIVTAMSGVAATLLNGETTHSVLGLNRDEIQAEESEEWQDARLLIIDECSFASRWDIDKMHDHLKSLMQSNRLFGGLNIVFAGDFSQLEPVGRDPLYNDYCASFQGALNCYIELDGKWRFINDPLYGEIMQRFRDGMPTQDAIEFINMKACHKTPPPDIQVATYTNKDRDAINAKIFEDFTRANKPLDGSVLEAACVIFMDELTMKDTNQKHVDITSNTMKRFFYENCPESECNYKKDQRGRVDPVLKLYPNCPMMMTQNNDVINGEANGSRVYVKEVVLKKGEQPFNLKLENGCTILAMTATQVDSIVVQHEAKNISPSRVDIKADKFHFCTRMTFGDDHEPLFCSMSGQSFPLISNSCTTGHKLQGCTVPAILVNTWFYGANWAYVVLSRVRTLDGLHLNEPLSKDLSKYSKPTTMKRMIRHFRDTIAVKPICDKEYEDMMERDGDDDCGIDLSADAHMRAGANTIEEVEDAF